MYLNCNDWTKIDHVQITEMYERQKYISTITKNNGAKIISLKNSTINLIPKLLLDLNYSIQAKP